jgi:uncharacterized repeat protein (TIGR04076 family)
MYKIIVTVKDMKGKCKAHKVGDTIEIVGAVMSAPICPVALMSFYHNIHAMKYGAVLPWAKDKDKIIQVCPDDKKQVTFEIRRVKIEE